MRVFSLLFFLTNFFFVGMSVAHAGILSRVSDTIVTSAPGATTTHTILFSATTSIPASGKIVITPDASSGFFDIPVFLDYTDIDMAIAPAPAGPFTERTLAPTPSVTDDGVSVVTGVAGSITITLGSGGASGILAGEVVRIKIGSNATEGSVGDLDIVSPNALGSHHMRFETRDAGDALIDFGSTVVVMVAPVTLGRVDTTDNVPPVRSNGLPTGLLPGGTQNVFVSLSTDKIAVCRYATSSGTDFFSMLSSAVFTSANSGTLHYLTQPVVSGTIYNYYVRCQKFTNTPNQDDYLISFEIGAPPGTSTPPAPPPPPSGGSSGSGGGGGPGGPFLGGGDVTIEGRAAPSSKLYILKDGVIEKETTVSVLGDFSEKFTGLPRGTYAWGAYIRDASGRVSSTHKQRYCPSLYFSHTARRIKYSRNR